MLPKWDFLVCFLLIHLHIMRADLVPERSQSNAQSPFRARFLVPQEHSEAPLMHRFQTAFVHHPQHGRAIRPAAYVHELGRIDPTQSYGDMAGRAPHERGLELSGDPPGSRISRDSAASEMTELGREMREFYLCISSFAYQLTDLRSVHYVLPGVFSPSTPARLPCSDRKSGRPSFRFALELHGNTSWCQSEPSGCLRSRSQRSDAPLFLSIVPFSSAFNSDVRGGLAGKLLSIRTYPHFDLLQSLFSKRSLRAATRLLILLTTTERFYRLYIVLKSICTEFATTCQQQPPQEPLKVSFDDHVSGSLCFTDKRRLILQQYTLRVVPTRSSRTPPCATKPFADVPSP